MTKEHTQFDIYSSALINLTVFFSINKLTNHIT